MSLVLEKARELAEALGSSEEYAEYTDALRELEEHEAAKVMFRDIRKKQMELQLIKAQGKEIPELQMKQLERLVNLASSNEYVRTLLAAEYRFAQMFSEVQSIIGKAVGMGEDGEGESESGNGDGNGDGDGPSRIIVP